jgi:hypothetical protein
MSDQIVLEVIEKYAKRSEVGIAKYGTTLETNNKDNYLKHLQEELIDQNKEITNLVRNHPNDAELGMKIRDLIR